MHAQAFTYGFPGRILDRPATKYRLEVAVLIQVVREAERLSLTLDQDIAERSRFLTRLRIYPARMAEQCWQPRPRQYESSLLNPNRRSSRCHCVHIHASVCVQPRLRIDQSWHQPDSDRYIKQRAQTKEVGNSNADVNGAYSTAFDASPPKAVEDCVAGRPCARLLQPMRWSCGR